MKRLVCAAFLIALGLAACSADSELTAEPSFVAGRTAEGRSVAVSEIGWFPLATDATVEVSNYLWAVGPRDDQQSAAIVARFTLSIRDPAYSYEVQVPYECFKEIRVGAPVAQRD